VVCPKCGEVNSDKFRFCGLCGTVLEARLDSRRPSGAPVQGLPKRPNAPEPLRPPVVENATVPASHQVPPISGPSMLGLNQPGANQTSPNQPSANLPSMDSLRETAFSGLDSFFEPEQPKTGGRRILLLVILLAALGGAGWWTYTNYLGATDSRKPEPVTSSAGEAPAEKPPMKPSAKDAAPASDASSSQAVASAGAPQSQPGSSSADSDATRKNVDAEAMPVAEAKPNPTTVAPAVPKIVPHEKSRVKREPSVTSAKASAPPAPAAADTGDAAFRKGEAYLYGRGVPENCDEAVKNLKAASAKSNAKARSAFGTMYATGHCVPRDLPTSYLWFALALRVDPNNQILEKDLSAVWNQMTPPERQMATRMKQ
jgi:hypothetical protein